MPFYHTKFWRSTPTPISHLPRNKNVREDPDEDIQRGLAVDHHKDERRADEEARDVAADLGPAELRAHDEGVPAPLEAPHGRRQRRGMVRVAPPVAVLVDLRLYLGQNLIIQFVSQSDRPVDNMAFGFGSVGFKRLSAQTALSLTHHHHHQQQQQQQQCPHPTHQNPPERRGKACPWEFGLPF